MLIALAFGVSVGSTMTQIGNPQNFLIVIQSGISLPLITSFVHLAAPTLLNLFLTYIILRVYFRKDLLLAHRLTKYHQEEELSSHTYTAGSFCEQTEPIIKNPGLTKISSTILLITIAGFIISELLHFLHTANIGLSLIALLGATALYLVSGGSERKDILRE